MSSSRHDLAVSGSDSISANYSPPPPPVLRKHPASLVPKQMHEPLLLSLLKAPVNDDLVEYVAECTLAVVPAPEPVKSLPTPPSTPVKSNFCRNLSRTLKQSLANETATKENLASPSCTGIPPGVPSLSTFIKLTSSRSNAQAPTLLVTLVYLDRLRHKLRGAKAAKGMQCTYHRLFLACMIAAAKYCNDCCPRNLHWVKWSGLFTLSEVNLMEQELFMLLDYELRVQEKDLIKICAPFLPPPTLEKLQLLTPNSSSFSFCTTSRSSSYGPREEILTPESSPPALRHHQTGELAGGCDVQRKKFKFSETAAGSTVTVITRAKSWYGSLRGGTS